MNVYSRGFRNAFRNQIRTIAIVGILALSIGLSLSMLVAHNAVTQKINRIKANAGNTINISPAGFSNFSQVNNALTTSDLAKVAALPHISTVSESLTDRLNTIGSSRTLSLGSNSSSSTNQTSLTSPVTINFKGGRGRFFAFGGQSNIPTTFTPPITITGTNNPYSLNGQSLSLTSGNFINGATDSDNSMVSTAMASKNNLKIGSSFTAYGTTLVVVGIFSNNKNQGIGNTLLVSLAAEQRLSGQSDAVTSSIATVDSSNNLNSATSAVKNTLGSNADVASSQDLANATIQPLNNVSSISLYSLIGSVAAGAVIILMVMVMITRERRKEIGVLKAIGASNVKVVLQFVSEAVTFAILAAVIGIIIGIAGASPITNTLVSSSSSSSSISSSTPGGRIGGANLGQSSNSSSSALPIQSRRGLGRISNAVSNVHAVIGWSIIAYGLGTAIIIAVIGSGMASLFIAKIRPAEVMRME